MREAKVSEAKLEREEDGGRKEEERVSGVLGGILWTTLTTSTKPLLRRSSQGMPREQAEYVILVVLCLIKAWKAGSPWHQVIGAVSVDATCWGTIYYSSSRPP